MTELEKLIEGWIERRPYGLCKDYSTEKGVCGKCSQCIQEENHNKRFKTDLLTFMKKNAVDVAEICRANCCGTECLGKPRGEHSCPCHSIKFENGFVAVPMSVIEDENIELSKNWRKFANKSLEEVKE